MTTISDIPRGAFVTRAAQERGVVVGAYRVLRVKPGQKRRTPITLYEVQWTAGGWTFCRADELVVQPCAGTMVATEAQRHRDGT